MTPALVVGGLLVLAGIFWASRTRSEPERADEREETPALPVVHSAEPVLAAEGCS